METTRQSKFDARRHKSFIGLTAGLIAGILNVIVARVLMRIIAILTVGRGTFSVEGTLNIVLFGVLLGPLFGLMYRLWFYRLRYHDLVKGLIFGLVIAVVLQVPTLFIFPDFRAELMAVGPLGFVIFGVMSLSFMLTLAVLTAWLEQRWPNDNMRKGIEIVLSGILGLLALLGLLLLVLAIGGPLFGVMPF